MDNNQDKYRRLKGIIYTFLWYFSIWAGFLFVCCPLWIFILICPRIFLPVMSAAFSIWEMYPVALMNVIFKTKIRITGDKIDPRETSILIVNHRTRIDWNFLWALMYYGCQPRSHRMKITLKAPLRHMPSLGWVMQVANCLYLQRKWEKDEVTMKKQLKYFKDVGDVFQMLLFPEGTDFCENNMKKSNEYAALHNLESYSKVLHPKTTGFVYFVNTMRSLSSNFTSIYDLTLAYSDCIPQTEKDIIVGNFPKVVNFHVTRYPISAIPAEKEDLKNWINTRWKEKEVKLIKFDEEQTFRGPAYVSDMDNALHLAFFFWTSLLVAMFYFFFTSTFCFWWTILHVCLFVGISYMTEGYQKLCVDLWEFMEKRRNKNK